jgi:ribosomal protein S18 acetylase RimI-like enzyme
MPEPTYREIPQSDIPIAQELRAMMIREMGGKDPDAIHPTWRQRYLEFYSTRMAQQRAALFLAEVDSKAIGVTAVYMMINHRSEIFGFQSAYVSNVWVAPEWRRRGIASKLTRMAVEWARQKGCEVIRLRSSKMGRPVYAGLGFVATDEMEFPLSKPAT